MMAQAMKPSDRWIPFYFVLFFLVVAALDGIFVYLAVSTQTGTVSDRAYENGLAFNKILAAAADQDKLGISQNAQFENGVITWDLKTANGRPLTNAVVTARIIRPTTGGHDFTIHLLPLTPGRYQTKLVLPLQGEWMARLKAQWDTHTYQTNLSIISR